MAFTPEQEQSILTDLDILFKLIYAGKAATNLTKEHFEEPLFARKGIFPSQIITEEELIPQNAAEVSEVIELIQDLSMLAVEGSPGAYYHPDLAGSIPFSFGDGASYLQSFKRQDGSLIPFGQNGMLYNPHAGVVYFRKGSPDGVDQDNPPKITTYKYIGKRGFAFSGSEHFDSVISIETDPDATKATAQFGDRFLIGEGAINSWSDKIGQIAEMKNVIFRYQVPEDGSSVKVDNDDGKLYHHEGDYQGVWSWIPYSFNTVRIAFLQGTDNYTADINPPINGHSSDTLFVALPTNNNTGPSTFNPDSKGAVDIKVPDGNGNLADIQPDTLRQGFFSFLWFDGGVYQLFTADGSTSTSGNEDDVLSTSFSYYQGTETINNELQPAGYVKQKVLTTTTTPITIDYYYYADGRLYNYEQTQDGTTTRYEPTYDGNDPFKIISLNKTVL